MPADALLHQRVRRIHHGFDRFQPVMLLAFADERLGEREIVEDGAGVGPLLEQVVVLEEVVVAESGVGEHQHLHGHGILFHDVADAGIGIDHDLIGQRPVAALVHRIFARKMLAERPVPVHLRHSDRCVGVQHLLGGDDLDLVGVNVEPHLADRDFFDGGERLFQEVVVPLRALIERCDLAFALCRFCCRHRADCFPADKREVETS